jgi:pantothenate kinase
MTAITGVHELIEAARQLIVPGERRILGIAGAPGAGKSTLAQILVEALDGKAALVGLDGFHLKDSELHRLGRHSRKGAADTFDAAGYVNLLRRLRDRTDAVVYAPTFDRTLEESIGSAIPITPDIPLIITEGNYLLLDEGEWGQIRPLLDASWFADPGEETRLERLVARHMQYGRSAAEARERSYGSDQTNADLINGTRNRADLIVRVPTRHDLVPAVREEIPAS